MATIFEVITPLSSVTFLCNGLRVKLASLFIVLVVALGHPK